MAALLTTEGIAHLAELDATWPSPVVTVPATGLVFGTNNATPALADTQAEIEPEALGQLIEVQNGYPVLGDTDPRNTGRASDRYTWKFLVPVGNPFVASNVALTDYNGGVLSDALDLLVHEKVQIVVGFDEELLVWVNAKTGATPTVVAVRVPRVFERVRRTQTWTARARSLRSSPSGARIGGNRLRVSAPRNHPVWTAALLEGCDGGLLTCSEVRRVALTVMRWNGPDGVWRSERRSLDKHAVVSSGTVVGDPRWPGGEFNFSHQWAPEQSSSEATYELRYTLELADRTSRTVDVEVRYT